MTAPQNIKANLCKTPLSVHVIRHQSDLMGNILVHYSPIHYRVTKTNSNQFACVKRFCTRSLRAKVKLIINNFSIIHYKREANNKFDAELI